MIERQTIQLRINPASVKSKSHRVIFTCVLKGLLGRRNGMEIGSYPIGSLVLLGFEVNCDEHRLGLEVGDASLLNCPLLSQAMNDYVMKMSHPTADWSVLEPFLDLTH